MKSYIIVGGSSGIGFELTRRLLADSGQYMAPSLTDTPLAQALLADEGKRTDAVDRHPLNRTGTPHEPADIAHFLLSDSASWITG